MKKKRILKICVAILAVVMGICLLDSGTAHATNEGISNNSDKANSNEVFHVMADGGLDIYYPDKDPNYPNVIIPEEINGIQVTYLLNDTFKNKGMKSIEIPNSIKGIAMQAFMGNSLERVKLPSNLKAINGEAFSGNKSLKSIEIPETVTYIGSNAFDDCGLTSLYLSDNVETIGMQAFSSNDLTEVRLPLGLKKIDSGVFAHNKRLKKIEIPDTVTQINNDAFRDSGLESVKLPSQLTWLGTCSFMNNMIKSVTIPGTVTNWGQFAFANNTLESVIIEEGVKDIASDFMNSPSFGNNMFNNLSSVKLPSTAKSIGYYTFAESSLLYFDLPPSITNLGSDCFLEQKVTMDFKIENDKSVVKLPKEMSMSKFDVSTQGVTIDSINHELSIPKGVKQIEYSYKLGTFSNVERFLTGTLTLGNGLVKVKFLDYDDSVLEEVETVLNGTVSPSKTPIREGYTFIGWDKSLENITESQDFKAQYKILPELTVNDRKINISDTFDPLKDVKATDADGNEIKDIQVIKNTVDTSKEGTYQVILEVKDQWGGKNSKQYNVIVESKFIDKVLKDKDTGISIKGSFTTNAKVIVELTPVPTPSLNNKIKDKNLINAFEVHVVGGEFQGELIIKFPLDEKFNDTLIYVYHEKTDGTIEEFKRIVKSGFVEITVDELSPFVLAKDRVQQPEIKPEESTTPSDSVQTGDQLNILIPSILLIMTELVLMILIKKQQDIA